MLDSAPSLSGCCACGSDGFCSSECKCASPETPIATPTGDRPIASLSVGNVVFSINGGRMIAVPIREIHRTPVTNHQVIEVALLDGATLRVSAAHPTADGRSFGQLHAGDWLGGREVASAHVVPYAHDATYDILPDSDTGTYFAGGALIGSTLASSWVHARQFTRSDARSRVLQQRDPGIEAAMTSYVGPSTPSIAELTKALHLGPVGDAVEERLPVSASKETMPYALNFERCWETADWVTPRISARSHTQHSLS